MQLFNDKMEFLTHKEIVDLSMFISFKIPQMLQIRATGTS